ncbi:hypothetical protein ACOSQ3_018237 [Xanthoceras sorbifolium]
MAAQWSGPYSLNRPKPHRKTPVQYKHHSGLAEESIPHDPRSPSPYRIQLVDYQQPPYPPQVHIHYYHRAVVSPHVYYHWSRVAY